MKKFTKAALIALILVSMTLTSCASLNNFSENEIETISHMN